MVESRYDNLALAEKALAFFAVIGTAAGTLAALTFATIDGYVEDRFLLVFAASLLLSGIGVSLGLHRLFCHQSFVPHSSVKIALAVLGVAAGQGYFFRWINDHTLHHRYADRPGDPHSPYYYKESRLGLLHGLLHAHFLWLFRGRALFSEKHLGGCHQDPILDWIDRRSVLIVSLGIVIPGAILFVFDPRLIVFVKGCLWGGFVRMFVLNNTTWMVNSVGHAFGSKLPSARDESRNNTLLGIIAFGDGWHANHHKDPRSARHGWRWWQFDLSWTVVVLLRYLGLVRQVRTHRLRRQVTDTLKGP